MAGNREYKSDVFCMLMEDKGNALQLYNAINGSHYTDPELVEMKTLDEGVSLTVRNDAAFVLDVSLSLYEHQASICPNMPVRNLIYYSHILQLMLKKRDIYGRSLVKIPVPKFAVFYNGLEDQPEQYDQRLSDAFERMEENPQLELLCRVYNINHGKNKELLDKCPFLKEYMIFVDYVRAYDKESDHEDLKDAIERAIDRCIEENVLRDFLIERRSEVVKVMQLDYTFERRIELQREEAWAEGLKEGRTEGVKEGRAEGLEEGISNLVASLRHFKIPTEAIAGQLMEKYNLKPDKALEYAKKYN